MKTQIIEKDKGFSPITVEITFESPDELIELWHRTNINFDGLKEDYKNSYSWCKNRMAPNTSAKLWGIINRICDSEHIDPFTG